MLGLVVGGLLLWLAGRVLLLLFAAVLVALFLRGLTCWVAGHSRLGEGWSLAAVIAALLAGTVGLFWGLAPRVAEQLDQLGQTIPQSLDRYSQFLMHYEWGRWLLQQTPSADQILSSDTLVKFGSVLSSNFGALLGGAFSSTAGLVVSVALLLIVGIYLAAEAPSYRGGLLRLVPRGRRERAGQIVDISARTLQGWMIGRFASMALLSVFIFVGLSLLDVPLALTLALFAALLTFVPNLGAIVSALPPILLALADSPVKALYVLLLYIVLQSAEGMLLTPLIQRKVVSLPPALLISSQLLMAALFGFWGLLLAAPTCALGLVLVKLLYIEDVLGEPVEIPGYSSAQS